MNKNDRGISSSVGPAWSQVLREQRVPSLDVILVFYSPLIGEIFLPHSTYIYFL